MTAIDLSALKSAFADAKKSDSYSVHQEFIKRLLADNHSEVMKFHYGLLADTENRKLYQRIRAAFLKRGKGTEGFLIDRAVADQDIDRRADALQLLGHLRCREALPLMRQYIAHPESVLRYNSLICLGWMACTEDVALLGKRLLVEPDPKIRGYVATALRQIFLRNAAVKREVLSKFFFAAMQERNEESLQLLIASAQVVAGTNFGLREDIENATITGLVEPSRAKFIEYMARFDSDVDHQTTR